MRVCLNVVRQANLNIAYLSSVQRSNFCDGEIPASVVGLKFCMGLPPVINHRVTRLMGRVVYHYRFYPV